MGAFKYKISFRLNSGKALKSQTKPTTIFFRYVQGRNFEFSASTGIKAKPNNWSKEKSRLKQKANIPNREYKNQYLSNLEAYFHKELIKYRLKAKRPTKQDIKDLFDDFMDTKTIEQKTLFDFIESFIYNAPNRLNTHTKRPVSKNTIKGYQTTFNILKDFHSQKYRLSFSSMTISFYYDFIEFCESRELSYNYIGKLIKNLKTFLSHALQEGYPVNEAFKKREFATLKEDSDAIYLNEKELLRIYNLGLKDRNLDIIRDLFLVGAYTGLRVSDYTTLNISNIHTIGDVQIISIKAQKTSKLVAIPLHPIVKGIFEKYNGHPPPKKTPQAINTGIKKIGKLAGIDSKTTKKITIGGKQTIIKKPKYSFIQTHTARRSFCTNAYLAGMPRIDIMAISGHKKETTFLKYIKISAEHRAVKLSQNAFFNPKTFATMKKLKA